MKAIHVTSATYRLKKRGKKVGSLISSNSSCWLKRKEVWQEFYTTVEVTRAGTM